MRITINASSEKEFNNRVADNEKRGWKVIQVKKSSFKDLTNTRKFSAIMEK